MTNTKIWITGLLVTLLISGCSSSAVDTTTDSVTDGSTDASTETESQKEEGSVEVDDGLFNVEISFPVDFFGEEFELTQEQVDETVAEEGWVSGEIENGVVTYVMPKSARDEFLGEQKDALDEAIQEEFAQNPGVYEEITYNDNLTEFEAVVDREAFENSFTFFAFSVVITAGFYQLFDGTPEEERGVVISYVDKDTGEVFDTYDSDDLGE
jgi:hypothetical protein